MCRLCINNCPRMDLHLTNREKQDALKSFQELIRFETVSSCGVANGSYDACAHWILNELHTLQVNAHIIKESVSGKPIVVATFLGADMELPGILFNAHYDVVPAATDYWTVAPFDGIIKENKLYGRGTQDMKCVVAQYIVAIKKMRRSGYLPKRNLFYTFVPDEEIGGADGMDILITSDWFKEINIGLAFDEGLATESDDTYSIFYGERVPWWVNVVANGNTGHASRFIENTAVEKIIGVANKALAFRQEQKDLLHGVGDESNGVHGSDVVACSHVVAAKKKKSLGDVTTLNLTRLEAGISAGGKYVYNVVPPTAECSFDIRVSPHMEIDEMVAKLNLWCEECSAGRENSVKWEFTGGRTLLEHHTTSMDANVNPWFNIFSNFLEKECSMKVDPCVFPAATDSRFLRALGIRAIGFSPMRSSPVLLHEHDEYLNIDIYYEGCEVYIHLMMVLGSQGMFDGDISYYGATATTKS